MKKRWYVMGLLIAFGCTDPGLDIESISSSGNVANIQM